MLNFTKLFLFLLLSLFLNNIHAIDGSKKMPSPCIEFLEPLPYNPDSMYMSYFNYQFAVASGIGVPSIDYPTMYIYAHEKSDFQKQIIDLKPIDFSGGENDGTALLSQKISFNLKYLEPFYPLCDNNSLDTLTGNYTVVAVTIVNGIVEPYHLVFPELFPDTIFEPSTLTLDVFHYFYCEFPIPLNSPTKSDIQNKNLLEKNKYSVELDNLISVYPNPFTNELLVDIGTSIPSSNSSIEVVSPLGHIEYSTKISGSISYLELSFLKPGVYTIIIINGKQREIKKVVKTL